MRRWSTAGLLALLILTIGWLGTLSADGRGASGESGTVQNGPVLLELFTSQGCSSCPPADELLARLAEADPEGECVIPLSFHVDYWNYIGWSDPFSDEAWSNRQRAYGEAFRDERIYTPQIVVNGRVHCVGSRARCVQDELNAALARPRQAQIDLAVTPRGGKLDLRIAGSWLGDTTGQQLGLWVALFESSLVTDVGSGENARRRLANDYVVRRLVPAGRLTARQGGSTTRELSLRLDPEWKAENVGVAAFLQHPTTREVFAGARWQR